MRCASAANVIRRFLHCSREQTCACSLTLLQYFLLNVRGLTVQRKLVAWRSGHPARGAEPSRSLAFCPLICAFSSGPSGERATRCASQCHPMAMPRVALCAHSLGLRKIANLNLVAMVCPAGRQDAINHHYAELFHDFYLLVLYTIWVHSKYTYFLAHKTFINKKVSMLHIMPFSHFKSITVCSTSTS